MFNEGRSHDALPKGMLGHVVLCFVGAVLESHDLFKLSLKS